MGDMPDAALCLAIASSANTPLEENSTEIPLRGVPKKPHSLSPPIADDFTDNWKYCATQKFDDFTKFIKMPCVEKARKKTQRFRGCSLFLSDLKQMKTKNSQCTA